MVDIVLFCKQKSPGPPPPLVIGRAGCAANIHGREEAERTG